MERGMEVVEDKKRQRAKARNEILVYSCSK